MRKWHHWPDPESGENEEHGTSPCSSSFAEECAAAIALLILFILAMALSEPND